MWPMVMRKSYTARRYDNNILYNVGFTFVLDRRRRWWPNITHESAKLNVLNNIDFRPLEVVSCYRDPQL